MVDRKVEKAVGERREAWKVIEGIRDRGEQPSTGTICTARRRRRRQPGGQRTEHGGVWRKNCTESLDDDVGQKMIFKMARDRTEDGKDVK